MVRELQHVPFNEKGPLDQKNIRRRVYDALNVLMAMGIIAKERKEIRWLGLPNAKSAAQLEYERLEVRIIIIYPVIMRALFVC